MDGVISDTQKLHAKVESELLSRFNVNFTPEEITFKYAGVKTKEFFNDLLSKEGKEFDLDQLMKEKWEKMETLAKDFVEPIDGIYELLKMLKEKGIKIGLGSASNKRYIEIILKGLEIEDYFESIVGGDMVDFGKPAPDIFLLAAKKLDIEPENCLVIEDGISGMIAANKGNMECIGLVKEIDYDKYPTKNQVLSLREITWQYLEANF